MRLMPEKLQNMHPIKKLHLETLPPSTLKVFELFDSHSALIKNLRLDQNLCLVGGTALSLQINHRRSNDLDLACFDKKLPNYAIDEFLSHLRSDCDIRELNSMAQVSTFKIQTGLNLLDYVRDFTINDVKVTFFTLGKTDEQRLFYKSVDKVLDQWAFPLMGIEGLELSKTLVLKNRVRSRDLYDMKVLMETTGYNLNSFIANLNRYSPKDDINHYRGVLTGKIPLDRDDEGLVAVGVDVSIDQIYDFFKQVFKEYQLKVASKFID